MRNQHSDTRTMQAMHADLNCEPKGRPRWQAQEESQSPFRVVEATKRKEWGRDGKTIKIQTNKQTKTFPFPQPYVKAINGIVIKVITIIMLYSSGPVHG